MFATADSLQKPVCGKSGHKNKLGKMHKDDSNRCTLTCRAHGAATFRREGKKTYSCQAPPLRDFERGRGQDIEFNAQFT